MEPCLMQYMGSKRWMLGNGLGHLLIDRAKEADRFVDLFSGAGAVSWHVAEQAELPVLAVDLQSYSAILAKAIIGRTKALPSELLATEWIEGASELRSNDALWAKACEFAPVSLERNDVMSARGLCGSSNTLITRSYGGHYFSPEQALTADALLATMPTYEPHRSACLATLIWAVARCVAAPGHTAQPFQPTGGALPYL